MSPFISFGFFRKSAFKASVEPSNVEEPAPAMKLASVAARSVSVG
jgi:hypothetical protein